jgi:hypothetical protein
MRSTSIVTPLETQRKTEKERSFAARRGVGGGAKKYDSEKACSSVNHSIHSVLHRIMSRML